MSTMSWTDAGQLELPDRRLRVPDFVRVEDYGTVQLHADAPSGRLRIIDMATLDADLFALSQKMFGGLDVDDQRRFDFNALDAVLTIAHTCSPNALARLFVEPTVYKELSYAFREYHLLFEHGHFSDEDAEDVIVAEKRMFIKITIRCRSDDNDRVELLYHGKQHFDDPWELAEMRHSAGPGRAYSGKKGNEWDFRVARMVLACRNWEVEKEWFSNDAANGLPRPDQDTKADITGTGTGTNTRNDGDAQRSGNVSSCTVARAKRSAPESELTTEEESPIKASRPIKMRIKHAGGHKGVAKKKKTRSENGSPMYGTFTSSAPMNAWEQHDKELVATSQDLSHTALAEVVASPAHVPLATRSTVEATGPLPGMTKGEESTPVKDPDVSMIGSEAPSTKGLKLSANVEAIAADTRAIRQGQEALQQKFDGYLTRDQTTNGATSDAGLSKQMRDLEALIIKATKVVEGHSWFGIPDARISKMEADVVKILEAVDPS